MKVGAGLFAISLAAIIAAWWWLGQAADMPIAPIAPGEKLECLSYAPFRGEQTPLDLTTRIESWQIEEDLRRLAPHTGCVRTYSVHLGLEQIAPIAQRLGLKVLQGLWLGRDPEFNRLQIATAVGLAKRYPDVIRALVIGNEVLLRGELSANDLAAIIREVKAQVPVPVTYADVWEFWLRNRDLVAAVDFVTIHILPYWEDFPIAAGAAAEHVAAIRRQVAASFPGKDIMIGEVGWPSAGRMRESALPSPSNQARVLQEVIAYAKRDNFRVNLIEAFDQPWKRRLEGTVGGHWGILNGATRQAKFAWGKPVSDHPAWRWQAAGGVGLAAIVFATVFLAGTSTVSACFSSWIWAGITANAVVAGILVGWAIENVPIESLGIGGWVRSLAMAAVAIIAPIAGSAALVRGQGVPLFARILGRATERPSDPLALVSGATLVVLTLLAVQAALGLVFDPRYGDFPFAPLTAATVPYGVLALAASRSRGPRAVAETIAAIVLALSAVYIVPNEGFANWQALWLAIVFMALAAILARARDAQGS